MELTKRPAGYKWVSDVALTWMFLFFFFCVITRKHAYSPGTNEYRGLTNKRHISYILQRNALLKIYDRFAFVVCVLRHSISVIQYADDVEMIFLHTR